MTDITQSMPTLRQLELFLALATSEGIAVAGARVGMTPSATSHALRALETVLGTPIVDRGSPHLALTHAGELILPHVRDVFSSLHLIQTTAAASAGLKTGKVRVGSFGPSSSLNLLPPLLEKFKARHPGIEVHVTEKPDAEIEQDLQERRIEIGVVTLPKLQFDTHPLAIDEFVAVLPTGHPLSKSPNVSLRDLAGYPLVLTHAGSQELVSKLFSRSDIKPRVTHELSQLLSLLEFVARGQGVSVIASLAAPANFPGVVYRGLTPKASRRIGLACLQERKLSPAAHALWQYAKKMAVPKS
ncbi:LysR family transcriptional regulator [Pandoraea anhela]|uniref:Transcriptional regulator, LysR family protein n=1 Tax=Pandoraea anhela TaxID=2508295 RepID=A0A5E4R8I3_9BURK|nr:LysR family transcriptional regulator [Pandoraea anhela]VVD59447.1 transcriptional regulator, LysR family protein [Pandoraea anhela]